jgi:hypothetical protein
MENKHVSLPCAICGQSDDFRLIFYNIDKQPLYTVCLKCIDKAKNKTKEEATKNAE